MSGDEIGWLEPAKATLTDERFSDPDWLFERKLDNEHAAGLPGSEDEARP